MNSKKLETKSLPLLPLRGIVAFPNTTIHFDVRREKSKKALAHAMKEDQEVFLATQKEFLTENPRPSDLYDIGIVAKVRQTFKVAPDVTRVLVEGAYRAKIIETEPSGKLDKVVVERFLTEEIEGDDDSNKAEAAKRMIKSLFDDYIFYVQDLPKDIVMNVFSIEDPQYLTEYIGSHIAFPIAVKQELLEESNIVARMESLVALFEKEIQVLKLEKEIEEKTRNSIDQNQRDYYLREQMRVISEELGDEEGTSAELKEYVRKIEALSADEAVIEKLISEVEKFAKIPSMSQEAAVIRQYLDTVLELPFGICTTDKIDLKETMKILDADHYGLTKVKERITELLAVRKLSPNIKGQIICLVGPPGVGKTSIAKSIAKSMGREYVRISLGGVRDESDIRGHRKTYIGSMPGRIIAAIKQAKVANPLVLLDEIDKMGSDFRGDPSSAMLEVLDPEQNKAFVDHYIEVPFDLSDALFITTANNLSTIQAPLLDRMEIITLSSYTRDEKFNIAKKHLLPKQTAEHGLLRKQFAVTDTAIYSLIDNYTREAGVRSLERELATLARKATKQIVESEKENMKVSITAHNIKDFMGSFRFYPEKIYAKSEVGTVNGLAWTSVGGEMLRIEAAIVPGTGKIVMTGSLGDVMKESITIAISYIRGRAKQYNVDPDFYKHSDIHVHAPEGAVPKDGPSAGVTMITALISALTERPVLQNIAMTGEVTLRGRVLPIGGLKEKSMAAHRAGVKRVFIPKDNESDLDEIDEIVRKDIEFIPTEFVDTILDQVLEPKKKVVNTKYTSRQGNDSADSIQVNL